MMLPELSVNDLPMYFGSVSHVARKYGYTASHVRLLCETGRIEAWKSGDIWIIYIPSVNVYMAGYEVSA